MAEWIKDTVPQDLQAHPYQVDVLSSKDVAVLVKANIGPNYVAIATYNDYKDSSFNQEHGHWRISGHNGNWDNRILGWYPLPDIS